MAWRIDESVIRGEIDNRTRGRVTGRIWFAGRDEPVELELAGNAWRDVAGRRLEFVNPSSKPIDLNSLATRQTGVIGDCTASRKVKIVDVSPEELRALARQRKPFPWHWGNSLYLEWFSPSDGRIVIESANYQLTLGTDAAWEMTPEEEEQQRKANEKAMGYFMGKLGQAAPLEADASEPLVPSEAKEEEEWGEPQPLSEAEAEKMLEDSDRLVDRIQTRMEREGPGADLGKILDEELERRARERGEKPPTPEEEARRAAWIEEINRAADEATDNLDPELEAELETKHPLAEQAFALALRLHRDPEERHWIPPGASEEHPLVDLAAAAAKASAKLAGALNGYFWPPELDSCASVIVRLKRAHGYLDDARLAADVCIQQNLAEPKWLADARRELKAMTGECDAIITELRAKLSRGFD